VADTEVTWRGLKLGGDTGYILNEVTGWEDRPAVTDYDTPRSRGHGDHIGDLFSRSRIVTVSGKIADASGRDAMALALQGVSTVSSTIEDLTIDLLGRSLTAGGRIIQSSVAIGMNYSVGEIPFALQWKCPDPLRYGPAQAAASTGLPTSSGGMVFPMVFPMDLGTSGDSGRIVLSNSGTAPAPILATITGGLPFGYEISSGGQRLRYETGVPAGETLTLDTAEGTVLAQGTADRRANLTIADWIQVPPLSSITLQFSSLGGAYDPAARLTVPAFRPASW
jgi:hypothetical protein